MDRVFIVDGHSVIFTTPELSALHGSGLQGEIARKALIRILTDFQDRNEVSVVLVFDGQGVNSKPELRQEKDIMVIYSRRGQSADAVIERLAASYAERYDINVVSNDRGVLDMISVSGAHGMSVRSMWEIV